MVLIRVRVAVRVAPLKDALDADLATGIKNTISRSVILVI